MHSTWLWNNKKIQVNSSNTKIVLFQNLEQRSIAALELQVLQLIKVVEHLKIETKILLKDETTLQEIWFFATKF